MTTRPTDEEIRAMIQTLDLRNGTFKERAMLKAWLAERQAAMDGVTDEMIDNAIMIHEGVTSIPKGGWGDKSRERMRAALQSIAQPVKVPDGWSSEVSDMELFHANRVYEGEYRGYHTKHGLRKAINSVLESRFETMLTSITLENP